MKYLPLLPILFLSISLHAQSAGTSGTANAAGDASAEVSHRAAQAAAQSSTAASADAAASARHQAGQTAASATEATSVSAELTRKLDTRHAKVGDEVLARTTQTARLADGTRLPRGTKLVGKVTEVQARSKAEKSAHLAFALDHAVLRDGREVPVHAMLTSVTAVSAAAGVDHDAAASEGGLAGSTQGGARASGGGLLGGAGGAVGGAVGGVGRTAGNLGGTVESGAGSAMNDARAAVGAAADVGASGTLNHVPVANLPGVTLSSSADASSSGSLDASGSNIDLESGTRMTLNVSASQQ